MTEDERTKLIQEATSGLIKLIYIMGFSFLLGGRIVYLLMRQVCK